MHTSFSTCTSTQPFVRRCAQTHPPPACSPYACKLKKVCLSSCTESDTESDCRHRLQEGRAGIFCGTARKKLSDRVEDALELRVCRHLSWRRFSVVLGAHDGSCRARDCPTPGNGGRSLQYHVCPRSESRRLFDSLSSTTGHLARPPGRQPSCPAHAPCLDHATCRHTDKVETICHHTFRWSPFRRKFRRVLKNLHLIQ